MPMALPVITHNLHTVYLSVCKISYECSLSTTSYSYSMTHAHGMAQLYASGIPVLLPHIHLFLYIFDMIFTPYQLIYFICYSPL